MLSPHAKAQKIDLIAAARNGLIEEVQYVCTHAPEKVHVADSVRTQVSHDRSDSARQEGNTPLHKAASHNGCKAAGLLLQANAKVNARNNVPGLGCLV